MAKQNKVASAIFALVMIVAGLYCIISPELADRVIGILVGISILSNGLVSLFWWFANRGQVVGGGWQLANGILSCLVGFGLIASSVAQAVFATMIVFLLGFWMMAAGMIQVVQGMTIKRAESATGVRFSGSYWLLLILSGILVVIFAFVGMVNPMLALAEMTIMIGVCLVIAGIGALATTFAR